MTQPVTLLSSLPAPAEAASGEACGPGAIDTAKGPLPLKALSVAVRIDGLAARTEVEQTFVNNLGETLEATYIFPLPDRAAVTSFQLHVAGRVIDGLLKERGAARRDYDWALASGHRAAIAEEERPDVFTLRVGNLPAGEEARVKLTLVGPLEVDAGEATYRFPLVVAPRYIPGTALDGDSVGDGTAPDTDAVPDASRITPPVLLPGYPHPVRLGIEVDLNTAALAARALRSSLPAVSEARDGTGLHVRVVPGQRLDQDFILRFQVGEGVVTTSLVIEDEGGKAGGGTFHLTIVPPREERGTRVPRSVAFVLDRSGSMRGWKIVAARRAMARMVETLGEEDRFLALVFDSVVETLPGFDERHLAPATGRNRLLAAELLGSIEARGGTELAEPLHLAVEALGLEGAERDRVLVLVTDGQVGNEDQLLKVLAGKLQGIRVLTLGIDRAVNAGFLHRLAAAGGGVCELVESHARIEEVMDKLHRLLATPVLTDLRLDPAGLEIEADSVTPSRLPALFAGVPVTIAGRWSGGSGSLALRAKDASGGDWAVTPRVVRATSGALAALWARGRIRDLEDEYASQQGYSDAVEERIVATSVRFGVLSRFTAYVAVDRASKVDLSGGLHRVSQATELPQGWLPSACAGAGPDLFMIEGAASRSRIDDEADLDLEAGPPRSLYSAHRRIPAVGPRDFVPQVPQVPKPVLPVVAGPSLAKLVGEALKHCRAAAGQAEPERVAALRRVTRILAEISVRQLVSSHDVRQRLHGLCARLIAALQVSQPSLADVDRLLPDCSALLAELRRERPVRARSGRRKRSRN